MPTKPRKKPPRIHASLRTPRAPRPGASFAYPWRFKVGEWARIRDLSDEHLVQIVDGFFHKLMPHFVVRTKDGDYWRIPQIHLRDLP
jgi:hypothetical protein